MVLDEGRTDKAWPVGQEPPRAWPPGETVLVSVGSGSFRILESLLLPDRDRSDEADCEPIT